MFKLKLNLRLLLFIFVFYILGVLIFSINAEAKIFEPSMTDQSVLYLQHLFGDKIGGVKLVDKIHEPNLFLSELFQMFNSFILAISIFILSYIGGMSTINTAQDGQVFGKKFSSVWIPLRSISGLLLLSPIPGSGYSSMQAIVMWIVLNGIGASDTMWDFALNNLSEKISVSSKKQIENKDDDFTLIHQGGAFGKQLLNSMICMELINKEIEDNASGERLKYINFEVDSANSKIEFLNFGYISKDGTDVERNARKSLCGRVVIDLSSFDPKNVISGNIELTEEQEKTIINKVMSTKKNATMNLIPHINNVARAIVASSTKDSKNNVHYNFDFEKHKSIFYPFIEEYKNVIAELNQQFIMNVIGRSFNNTQKNVTEFVINEGRRLGWLSAGSYYYVITQGITKKLLSIAKEPITIDGALFPYYNYSKEPSALKTANIANITEQNIKNSVSALKKKKNYINHLFKSRVENDEILTKYSLTKDSQDTSITSILSQIFGDSYYANVLRKIKFDKLINESSLEDLSQFDLIAPFVDELFILNSTIMSEITQRFFSSNDDPLIAQVIFGTKLMQLSESFWVNVIILSLKQDMNGYINELGVEGSKLLNNVLGIFPAILTFGAVLWGIGASLSIYLPMVPYMIFIITALGWFLLVIEAIVACPIVALGFIMPSQDELGKIVPALGIIANIFLKPILMIMGLIMSTKLYAVLINMVNVGFKLTFLSLQIQVDSCSTFSWIVMLLLYTTFIVGLVSRSYALIYVLPDKILRWIGVTGEQTDVSFVKETQQQHEQSVKQAGSMLEAGTSAGFAKFREKYEKAANMPAAPGGGP